MLALYLALLVQCQLSVGPEPKPPPPPVSAAEQARLDRLAQEARQRNMERAKSKEQLSPGEEAPDEEDPEFEIPPPEVEADPEKTVYWEWTQLHSQVWEHAHKLPVSDRSRYYTRAATRITLKVQKIHRLNNDHLFNIIAEGSNSDWPTPRPQHKELAKRAVNRYTEARMRAYDAYLSWWARLMLQGGYLSTGGVHEGPRGGVYHYSKNGNKVYHKKR